MAIETASYSKKSKGTAGRRARDRAVVGQDPGDKDYKDPHWFSKKSNQKSIADIPPEAIPEDMYTLDGRRVKDIAQEARDKETVKELAPAANEDIKAQAQPGITGQVSKAYGADPNNKYTVQYEVRELDNLISSNTPTGAVNPDYPAELQPRDRTRAASKAQVIGMASGLVPDMLIEEFHSTDRGAPIIGPDGVVESGNGRVSALRKAAEEYPDKYLEYKTELTERAAERGLDPGRLAEFKNPVLVRVRLGEESGRVEFAREANTAAVLSMSGIEQSKTDAARLRSKDLINFSVGSTGDLGTDIERRDNREFVRAFMGSVPETERGALMGSAGELTQEGNKRIQAAMFTKVYDDTQVAALHFESTDSNVKNITGGLMSSLGQMAKAEEMIKAGNREESLSIVGDISAAVRTYKQIKDRDDMTVDMYLDQSQMFTEYEISPTQKKILIGLHERSRSSKKVKDLIGSWANVVQQQPHPDQADLFGPSEPVDRDRLIDAWLGGSYEGHNQQELF